jgi:hypothetical protein
MDFSWVQGILAMACVVAIVVGMLGWVKAVKYQRLYRAAFAALERADMEMISMRARSRYP